MKDKSGLFVVMVALLTTSATASAQDPNFHIYLCFGQSNMEGPGRIEDQDRTVDDRFLVLQAVDAPNLKREKGKWYPAVPPLVRGRTGIGPADYFGRTMVAALSQEVRIGVVNVAVAGCKIELFDKEGDQAYAATVQPWMTNIIKEYDGSPYQRLVEMGKLAKKDGVIKGILLHQGESNTNDKQWPQKVKLVYDNLIKDLELNSGGVPLLAGELVNADQNGACASMNKIIADLPNAIPNAHVISSAGLACRPDRLHFTTAAFREFGKRYAEQMLSIMGDKAAAPKAPPKKEQPKEHVE
jgi:hypothetical protein